MIHIKIPCHPPPTCDSCKCKNECNLSEIIHYCNNYNIAPVKRGSKEYIDYMYEIIELIGKY